MSYYYLSNQKVIISAILGILLTGVTVTNSIAFALMAIFLLKNKKDIIKVGISCALGFTLILFLLPYKEYLIENFFNGAQKNLEVFSENSNVSFITYIKMVFFYILTSPLLFIRIIYTKPDGLDFFNFDLSANIIVVITSIVFFIFIGYNVIRNIKDRNMLAAFSVFIYNMLIHVVLKYGLYEGTIYGLHFLFTEILMFAFGFKINNKIVRKIFISFAIILLMVQIRYNLNGMLNLLLLFKDWS